MAVVWLLYGYCMAVVWLLYGCCLVVVWLLYGCCMVVVWLLFGCCCFHLNTNIPSSSKVFVSVTNSVRYSTRFVGFRETTYCNDDWFLLIDKFSQCWPQLCVEALKEEIKRFHK